MMTVDAALQTRRSVRGYRPDPVPDAVIDEVFALAQLAPSNCNAQPWVPHLVSGARLRWIGQRMVFAAEAGAPMQPDFPVLDRYPGIYRDRQVDAARQLYGAMGIGRDDHEGRVNAFRRNLNAFGAPHAVFLFLPASLGLREAVDVGIYAQTLMLLLAARGIASCPQGALSFFPQVVRRELGLDDSLRLLMGIAFGYEDADVPANAARVGRADAAQVLTRHR